MDHSMNSNMIFIYIHRASLAVLGVLLSLTMYAQELSLLKALQTEEESLQKSLKEISYPASKVKKHFFYLVKTWQNSMVLTTKGEKFSFNGRYNLLNKSIEYKINSTVRTIHINKVSLAKVGETTLIPITQATNPDIKNYHYLEVLSFGEINLLKGYKLGRMAGSQGQSLIPNGAESHVYEQLFFTYDFRDVIALEKSKKRILMLFKNKQKDLREYSKSEKLKFGSNEDLIKIFDHYNSLLN